jgi:protein-S-isoprenylcysteine O-methyltransferase Ste14
MTAASGSDNPPQGINRRRLVLRLICLPVCIALFMFLPAGTWAWPKGWLFVLVLLGVISAVFVVLQRVYFPAMLAVVLVAALDDSRFHWFPVPWWVCGVGYALLLGGIGIVTWAEGVNKFFEVTVRIQTDRGHKVIDTGPYAIARHPGYVGGLPQWC